MSDLSEMLERPGDEATKPKRTRKPLDETAPLPNITEPSMASLQAENDELKSRLANIEQMLAAIDAGVPVIDAPPKRTELDRSRPAAKTRTMGGGVTFEQDGRRFDARGRLMAEE